MPSFYINSKSKVYSVKSGKGLMFQEISEMTTFYRRLLNAKIHDVSINGETIKTTWNDNVEVIFDVCVFDNKYNVYNDYIDSLKTKINRFMERKNLSEYKKRVPDKSKRKINRSYSKNLGRLVAGTLATVTILAISATLRNNKSNNLSIASASIPEIDKPKIEETLREQQPSEVKTLKREMTIDTATMPEVDDLVERKTEIPDNDNFIRCELAFDQKTDGKMEATITNCAPYMEEYIERYGLPRDLTYAITCQENGSLTLIDDRIDAPNPMRIDPIENNGEFFRNIPVYKDGKLTGEYDSFYVVAKEADKNNPKYAGYKVLAIDNLIDHFQIGCANIRRGIDRYRNIFIAVDSNNKGLYAFTNVYDKALFDIPNSREYYENNFNDFTWTDFIAKHYKLVKNKPDFVYGDPNYIWNVLRYLEVDANGVIHIEYDYKGETIKVELTNQNMLDKNEVDNYNSNLRRG